MNCFDVVFFWCYVVLRDLHSFPTRRSSDLNANSPEEDPMGHFADHYCAYVSSSLSQRNARSPGDRKSTRLNSSHSQISYAVFCLKKKTCHCTSPPHRAAPRRA